METISLASKTSGFPKGSNSKFKEKQQQQQQQHHSQKAGSKAGILNRFFCCLFYLPRRTNVQDSRYHDLTERRPPTRTLSPTPKIKREKKRKRSIKEKMLPRRLSPPRSSSDASNPPIGTVGKERVYQLDKEHINSWNNCKDEVTKVLERNTSGKIGPKPVSLLNAYDVEYFTWRFQRIKSPTVVISCRSQSYGDLLKRELEKSLRDDLFDPSIRKFRVLSMQERFQPLTHDRPPVASMA